MKKIILGFGLVMGALAFGASSSNRTVIAQFLKNGTSVLTVPSSGNDVLVGRATTDTLTNKSIDGNTNTITNVSASGFTGQVPVASGGTGLASGTSGGILGYTASGVLASSAALTASQLVIGGGAGATPTVLAAGSQFQSLVMGASAPAYGAVPLNQSAAVSGALAVANGGTANASLAVTAGGVLYTDGSKVVNVGAGSSGQLLKSNTASPPTWATVATYTTPTKTILTSTGATTAYLFNTAAGNYNAGSTWTNNGQTFTALGTSFVSGAGGAAYMVATGTGAPLPSNTLTKTSGGGAATIVYGSVQALATYTTPANAKFLKVTITGGGGGGGGTGTSAAASGWGGNGSGGASSIFWITTPDATYYYGVGTGGAKGAAGNNAGTAGVHTTFVTSTSSSVIREAQGGNGGQSGPGTNTTILYVTPSITMAVAANGDININGSPGSVNILLSGTTCVALAKGGGTIWGEGPVGPSSGTCTLAGGNGANYGTGGTGGSELNNGGTFAGGDGAAGVVVVEEYY